MRCERLEAEGSVRSLDLPNRRSSLTGCAANGSALARSSEAGATNATEMRGIGRELSENWGITEGHCPPTGNFL
ncbi:hypothetical protein BJV77DRAFT_1000292 [Russula vinacea]|nr:hypothetical protein BJV77DRAFT_1000292 [Russula vinacea]